MITPAYSITATERVLPRLALDFTTAALDSRVTVTRALNTATRVNSSGLVEIVNANLPRFDYDPTTLLCKGLLIEETRINNVLYSEDFTQAVWGKLITGTGVLPVVTPNYATSPDGFNNGTRVQLNAGANGAGDYSLLRQAPVGAGTTVTRSIYAKSNTGSNQTVALVATNSSTKITITPTWQRIVLANSSAGPTQFDISVGGAAATPATADITIWGAQSEVAAFATSYMPTTSTSLTRNADVVSMTGTDFSSWYSSTTGSMLAEWDIPNITGTKCAYYLTNAAETERIRLHAALSNINRYTITSSGTTIVFNTAAATTGVTKSVVSFKASDYAVSFNGAAVATNTTLAAVPTTPDQLQIGRDGASSYLNGWMRRVAYWPQRLINSEVQSFSK